MQKKTENKIHNLHGIIKPPGKRHVRRPKKFLEHAQTVRVVMFELYI
jgi:hypothetical protein